MNLTFRKRVCKRTFDVIVSLLALFLFSPFFLICAFIIKLTSKGAILYRWKIIGKDGKKIISYKLRSMEENAEQREISLRKNGSNDMNGVYFKLKEDIRITFVGKFLRKFSIDEFPSLYSVLKGDMSLVGPRPVRWHEFEELKEWHKARFKVKPGITSPWVVNGKNGIRDFDEIAKLDLKYIENASILYDLKIILRTIPIVVFGKNY